MEALVAIRPLLAQVPLVVVVAHRRGRLTIMVVPVVRVVAAGILGPAAMGLRVKVVPEEPATAVVVLEEEEEQRQPEPRAWAPVEAMAELG
jgi:hypothetical protein